MAGHCMTVMEKFRNRSFFISQISSNRRIQALYILSTNIALLYCIIFQNLYLILIVIRFVKEGAIVWEMLSRFLTCLGLAVSFNFGLIKYKTAIAINKEMRRIHNHLKRDKVKLKKFPSASLFLTFGLAYILISEAAVALSFALWPGESSAMPDRDMWVKTLCVFVVCDYSKLSEDDKNQWFYVDLFLYTLATVSSGVFLSTMYSYHILSLVSFSKSTSANLKKESDASLEAPITREFVLKCRECCQSIKNLLLLCNNIFSGLFVIWYGVSLICTCAYCSQIMRKTVNPNPLQIALYFFINGQSFISVIIVSMVSSKLPNIFNKALTETQSMTLKRNQVSLDVFAELNILLSQVQSHPTGIEIGGCFLITKAFIVSYLGTIITFLMIVFQFESIDT